MINYTKRLDHGLRVASIAHDQNKQYRRGGKIPYIVHPFGAMLIASTVTEDEDVLIACLLHDVLEDVPSSIYSKEQLKSDFGERVLRFVEDVTKDPNLKTWQETTLSYLNHLKDSAQPESLIVCAADKIQNMTSINIDYQNVGNNIWDIFTTKSKADQIWFFGEIYNTLKTRKCPKLLLDNYQKCFRELKDLT